MDKYLIRLVLTIATTVTTFTFSHGQSEELRPISRHNFDSLVDKSIKLLRTTDIMLISDRDHIDIMLCLNTIFLADIMNPGQKIKNGRFKTLGRYKTLESLIEEKQYVKNITKVYPDFTWNKGMGYYFKKINTELYGTPSLNYVFKVTK